MTSYAHVWEILKDLYSVAESKGVGPMRARLQMLQKSGIPFSSNIGKGQRFDYGREDIYQMIFHLEMVNAGLMPAPSTELIKIHWNDVFFKVLQSEWDTPSISDPLLMLFVGSKYLVSHKKDEPKQFYRDISFIRTSALRSKIDTLCGNERSSAWMVINISNLCFRVEKILKNEPTSLTKKTSENYSFGCAS